MLAPTSARRSLVPLLLLAACSSEQPTSAPPDANGQPFSAGALSGITEGAVSPAVVSNGAGALVTGIAGHFTRLGYREPGGSNAPFIYFLMNSPTRPHIYRMTTAGTALQQLTFDTLGQSYAGASPDGSRVLYFQWDGSFAHSSFTYAYLMESNGSGKISHFADLDVSDVPAWTPDGDSVVYSVGTIEPGTAGLYIRAVATGGGRQLTADDGDRNPTVGLVRGERSVVFSRNGRLMQLILATGDTLPYFTLAESYLGLPQLSRDNHKLSYWLIRAGGSRELHFMPTDFPNSAGLLASFTDPDSTRFIPIYADWLPDGSGVVASLPSETDPANHQLYSIDTLGSRRLITTLTQPLLQGFSVAPAAGALLRSLIGPGAALGATASGILFGQGSGGTLTAVLAFQAGDSAAPVITASTGLNSTSPVLSFSITATQLTGLSFLNGVAGTPTVVIDAPSGSQASGAIVTFDAVNGQVALVLPYTLAPGEAPPTVEDNGSERVFHGHFLAAFGPDGRAGGEGGISAVRLDPRTRAIRFTH